MAVRQTAAAALSSFTPLDGLPSALNVLATRALRSGFKIANEVSSITLLQLLDGLNAALIFSKLNCLYLLRYQILSAWFKISDVFTALP